MFQYDFQSLLDEYTRALHGIADLVEYHDLDYNEIAKGKIKDILNNKTYLSKSPLSCEELLKIAHEAKLVNYMDGYVNWLIAALKKPSRYHETASMSEGIFRKVTCILRRVYCKNCLHLLLISSTIV